MIMCSHGATQAVCQMCARVGVGGFVFGSKMPDHGRNTTVIYGMEVKYQYSV